MAIFFDPGGDMPAVCQRKNVQRRAHAPSLPGEQMIKLTDTSSIAIPQPAAFQKKSP
jgi:hypothetical protein